MHSTVAFCLGLMASLAQGAVFNKHAALEDCLAGSSTVVDEVGSDDYNRDITPFNKRVQFTPAAIAVPTSVEQIQSAVACGSKLKYKVTAKCGGHSYASLGLGGEDGHLIIELDRMNSVKLNTETNIATVESGARLGHLAAELSAQGNRAISHGTCPGVGISGHVLHGGFGMSSHSRGLALDWVIGLNLLLANGTLVHASATENKDIYWGLLGAGSNFGIVTSFELKTFEAPANVTWFVVNLPLKKNNSVAALEALEDYALNTMPAELNMRLYGTRQFTQLEGAYQGNKSDLESALAPLLNKTGGTLAASGTTTWIKSLEHFATMKLNQTYPYTQVQEDFYGKSLELKGLNGSAAKNFVDYWFDVAKKETAHWYIQLDLHGGKNSAVWKADPELTSYAHRDKLYILQFYITTSTTAEDGFKFVDGWASTTTAPLTASDWGMYFNYPDTNLNRTRAQQMYWGKNLAKLQQLKAELDPNELFYYPVSISPAKQPELV
ncbi:putative glucooligosaccharide oxidase [Hypoxylon trugodes]|uniref:putative glucooligosaccharide oxidase n=1 Tax=Hypoxylon trugodes TaxID=326681 RepID=UPI0021A040D4|nr:putative glucooligosaccharide oxidase [Hypoxylon trugodes]KAI1390583.1 putative glucooligosaccharide oxidase [Hypoxylon trugodes]